jgi:hypothetical protein
VASGEGVIGGLVATGDGEGTVVFCPSVGESAGRGVIVFVSRGCKVGVTLCNGVAVATGVWRNEGVAFTAGDGINSRARLAVVTGATRRDGVVGEIVAGAAGILGEATGCVCRDAAGGLANGDRGGEDVGDAIAGLEAGDEVSACACVGFTKIFGGASGGGVDSDLIFARAFSAACRSGIPSQPRSTTVSATVSLTFGGRSAGCAVAISGAGI